MIEEHAATAIEVSPEPEPILESTAITTPLTIEAITSQVRLIQEVMRQVMISGEHYGVIPGTGTKPTLLKPGAEKLCLTFRLHPKFHVEKTVLDTAGHREYEITCELLSDNGSFIGQGVAICSTMESKYRYRNRQRSCPACGQQTIYKSKNEPGFFCWSKKGGCGANYLANDTAIINQEEGQMDNPDLADTYNTVKKMAQKRALVAAILMATAASDIFSQDLEAGEPASPVSEPPPLRTVEQNTIRTNNIPTKVLSPVTTDAKLDELHKSGSHMGPSNTPYSSNKEALHSPENLRYNIQFKSPPDVTQKQYLKKAGYKYHPTTYEWQAGDTEEAGKLYDTLVTKKTELLQNHCDLSITLDKTQDELIEEVSKTHYLKSVTNIDSDDTKSMSEDKINFLKECADQKNILGEEIYYEILNSHGINKSNQVDADNISVMKAIVIDLQQAIKDRKNN